jgi:hypothetical protein
MLSFAVRMQTLEPSPPAGAVHATVELQLAPGAAISTTLAGHAAATPADAGQTQQEVGDSHCESAAAL